MTNLKLEQIAYAQGWVESHIEGLVASATQVGDEQILKETEELLRTFKLFSDGFDEVRRENQRMERTLMMVRGAIQL